jgi:hypothetical protein
MTSRATVLLPLVFTLTALPARAQNGPPPNYQQLANQVAALQARVAKLEGNITASDLAGTYFTLVMDTVMTGFTANPFHNATIETSTTRASVTLNADGTGFVSGGSCEGSRLTQGAWGMSAVNCADSGPTGLTWAYANGVVTITFQNNGDQIPFSVGLGGRLLMTAASPFHPSDPSSDHLLFLLTRLQ